MALTIEDKNLSPSSVLYDANMKTMAVSLPQDVILFQIITRVPTESVIRFKCVSKQWNSFLKSDKFKKTHSRNLLKEPHLEGHNLFFISEQPEALFTINCESLPNKAPRRCTLPPFEASPDEDMPIQSNIAILTSFHGLVCLGIKKNNQYSDIILWNPLTTEYKILPNPPNHIECNNRYGKGYGLYYSSCEDDYKLLLVAHDDNVYIYSLKSDSWRNLNKKVPFQNQGFCWRRGFFLCENIYLLGSHPPDFSVRFDTKAERFHTIKPPPEYDNTNYPHCTSTAIHRGSIYLCVTYNIWDYRTGSWKSTCIEQWKFNADGDIWSKVVTYQLTHNDAISNLLPLHLMSNGKWLMWDHRPADYGGSRICQVDLKKKKYNKDIDGHQCKGKIKRKGNCYDEYKLLYYSDVEVFSPSEVRYIETFVSPNQYMK